MSQIIDVLGRLGIIALQENWLTPLDIYSAYKQSLSEENFKRFIVEEGIDNFRGHLTEKEIDKIMKPFPFKLSQEMYELYQIGNGLFPFDVSKIQEYDYCRDIANYYYFCIIGDDGLYSLETSIQLIKKLFAEKSFHSSSFLLPLCIFEHFVLLTTLNQEEKETSPIYRVDDTLVYRFYQNNLSQNDLESDEIWPSFTNMMLAYAEFYEKKDSPENINKKYGSNTDQGLNWFC